MDNTTLVPQGYKRDSIRIESKRKYDYGSLWIADFRHIPYGCSVCVFHLLERCASSQGRRYGLRSGVKEIIGHCGVKSSTLLFSFIFGADQIPAS